MEEYKIYDGEVYWRRDKYLDEVIKLRIGIVNAKFKVNILRIQEKRLRREIEKLKVETGLLKEIKLRDKM